MTPVSFPATGALATMPLRHAPLPMPSPVPTPAAPVVGGRVEWAGAVRPPDTAARPLRAETRATADTEAPTGPPPAFAVNMLDRLPDALLRVREAAAAPVPDPAEAAPEPEGDADPQAAPPDPAGSTAPAGYLAARTAPPPRMDLTL
jgi:hypothetical protein